MNNPPSGTALQAKCPRCDGPLPEVIYGYPNLAAIRELERRGMRPVRGGCIPNLPVRLECPRCSLVGLWSPRHRRLVPPRKLPER